MFRAIPGIGQRVPQVQATATGTPLPLEAIAAAAAKTGAPVPRGVAATIILPRADGRPAQVRFARPGAGRGRGAASPDILVDPVNGQVLGTFTPGMTPLMRLFHDLHGQLFLGRSGRQLVGWLGWGMTFLGLSGLYLWWPRKGQWRHAFGVRRKAKGLRFHRELHGAVGFWSLIVFLIVSFSGVAIVFPQAVRAPLSLVSADAAGGPQGQGEAPRGGGRGRGGRGAIRTPTVAAQPGTAAIGADAAIAVARRANPALPVQSVTLAARPDQAITVTMGAGRGTPVFVDPYRARVIATRGARTATLADKVASAMRTLHSGDGYGPVYWLAVWLSGLLPALFFFTGVTMWWKKRRNRAAMAAALAPEAAE
jgi:uncharacterized iron-regulated membrane protein